MGMVVPILPLLRLSNCWADVDPVLLPELFHKNTVELDQSLLALIYGRL